MIPTSANNFNESHKYFSSISPPNVKRRGAWLVDDLKFEFPLVYLIAGFKMMSDPLDPGIGPLTSNKLFS